MKLAVFAVVLAISTPAFAQQHSMSPSQLALGIDNDVGVLARLAEQQQQIIDDLKRQLAEAQAKLPKESEKK